MSDGRNDEQPEERHDPANADAHAPVPRDEPGAPAADSAEARAKARSKARELRLQQRRRDRRGRVGVRLGLVAALAGVAALVSVIIIQSVSPERVGPRNMLSDGITIGEEFAALETAGIAPEAQPVPAATPGDAAVAIRIYYDYQCQECLEFQRENSEQIAGWLDRGAATVEYHPLASLSESLGTQYSPRAANAAACVANDAPDDFYAFHQELLSQAPEPQTAGLSDDELRAIVAETVASDTASIDECIGDERFATWVEEATERALSGPLPGATVERVETVPTILVNGVRYEGSADATEFAGFVQQAAADAFNRSSASPSPAPSDASASPSPSPSDD